MEVDRHDRLAIFGGRPVREQPWPRWPRADRQTEEVLREVLHSGRWTFSGFYHGKTCYEKMFAEAFARYNGARFCVPVANGTSALMTALEGLGVGHGCEVLVPGVTWVACASAVVALGATPILVDVEPETLCMSAIAAKEAITPRTAAIMPVHLYCTVADLDSFLALSADTGIPLLEDCSQSHGAVWRGRRVGAHGKAGAFSMQHSKVLTSGEGGAIVTDDLELCTLMEQLRADGRRYLRSPPSVGHMELEEVGDVQGQNRCLSEFHAAILLDRLTHLDAENAHREKCGKKLKDLLLDVGGITPLARRTGVDALTYYQFCARVDREAFGGNTIDAICRALSAELGFLIEPIDTPLNANVLYNPLASPRVPASGADRDALNPKRFELPECTLAREECLVFSHHILLADEKDMADIATAFSKVKRASHNSSLESP